MEPNSNPSRKRARSPSPEDDSRTTHFRRRTTLALRSGTVPETSPMHEDFPMEDSDINLVDPLADAHLAEAQTKAKAGARIEAGTRAQASSRTSMRKPSSPKFGKPSAKPNLGEEADESDQEHEDEASGDDNYGGSPTLDLDASEEIQDARIKVPTMTGHATIKASKAVARGATTKSKQRGIDTSLPPMSDLYDIFKDIIDKALAKGLYDTIVNMERKVITVATMCSGTESPLLAWQMFQDELASRGECLDFQHMFSAELVPYKQAYIARNFPTKIIYRNILEIAENDAPSTAYGGEQPIPAPGEVQILIAGFSCVDFSLLNQHRKNLDGQKRKVGDVDEDSKQESNPKFSKVNTSGVFDLPSLLDIVRGESGDTLNAIIAYAVKYRPSLIILENILTAPWDEIRARWHMFGYVAEYVEVDTKKYYIPHTRLRKYMLCINTVDLPEFNIRAASVADAQAYADRWVSLVKEFIRPASSPVDAFLLSDTDSRLHRAIADLSRGRVVKEQPSKETAWAKCQIRHQQYRMVQRLGNKRPCTNWRENGPSRMLDHAKQDWTKIQVDRIKDTIDITWLLAAKNGFDPAYKPRYPDMSQNVDRHGNTAWGIAGCITPSGDPYSTTRGGPIVGIEALALQGIPVDRLHLTRETHRDLIDLAGNAMTSTVVGVALISALIAAYKAIPTNQLHTKARVLSTPLDILGASASLGPLETISLRYQSNTDVPMLFNEAYRSALFCDCEGQYSRAQRRILICEECSHTACEKCAGLPQHNYKNFQYSRCTSRIEPWVFRATIKKALPKRLKLASALNDLMLAFDDQGDLEGEDWKQFLHIAKSAFVDVYHYHSARRSRHWTILYDGQFSRLELQFSAGHAHWYLFAKTPKLLSGDAKLRSVLKSPTARMKVKNEHGSNLLQGTWQLCLPITRSFEVEIEGRGPKMPSWEARLGLDDFKTEQVWSELSMSIPDHARLGLSDVALAGLYKLCHLCGSANSMLHRRVSPASCELSYLFLLPDPILEPWQDSLVVATNPDRIQHGEYRHITATIGQVLACKSEQKGLSTSLRDPVIGNPKWRPTDSDLQRVQCSVYGKWVDADASLQEMTDHPPVYAFLSQEASVISLPQKPCKDAAIAVLSCEVPAMAASTLGWPSQWLAVTEANERWYLANIAWLAESVESFRHLSADWRTLKSSAAGANCTTCAPSRPLLKWSREGEKVARVRPVEDREDAARYEKEMSARPFIFRTCIKRDATTGVCHLVVHINVQALVHRAKGRFLDVLPLTETRFDWRLDPNYEANRSSKMPSFKIGDNKMDTPLPYTFVKGQQLRVEQQRSLYWLLLRESMDEAPFMLTEWEEDYLASINLRVEARARKPCQIMGGIVADRVGYGKTIIMLALIEHEHANAIAAAETASLGRIHLKATLIVTPHLLLTQWKGEIENFLGTNYNVMAIRTYAELNKYSIADFREADIILISFSLLANDAFLQRLARFAALPEPPSAAHKRAYVSWLTTAMERVAENVDRLRNSTDLPAYAASLNEQLVQTENDKDLYETIPSKRLQGAQYIKAKLNKAESTKAKSTKAKSTKNSLSKNSASEKVLIDQDPFHLNNAKTYNDLSGPLFQMFSFYRLIIDEYTYMGVKERELTNLFVSPRRWLLSGTPKLENFAQIQSVAGSIGIHLGIDDDARGILKTTSYKKDKTSAECFGSLVQSQSSDWLRDRHMYAQAFLDKFARQNIAEVGEIPREDYLMSVTLHAAERALYLELQTRLYGEDMRIRRDSSTTTDNDYINRMYEVISTSCSPEEALFRACSTFDISDLRKTGGTVNALQLLTKIRTREIKEHCEKFYKAIKEALKLKIRCGDADIHFTDYKRCVKDNYYGDAEASSKMGSMLSDAGKEIGLPQPLTLSKEMLKKVVSDLREQQVMLHKASIELVQRMRMLRFLRSILSLQQADVSRTQGSVAECDSCGRQVGLLSGLIILGQCGHIVCTTAIKTAAEADKSSDEDNVCLEATAMDDCCPVQGCLSAAFDFHKIPAKDFLDGPSEVDAKLHYGSKIADIVALIQRISKPKGKNVPGDQALVLVQFQHLMKKIEAAFTESDITFRTITGKEKDIAKEDRMLEEFKRSGKSDSKKTVTVLLLNASSSCAAGHNIQNANHVIFVSPLHASSQHAYDQAYEQAVGRALRFGQKKTVHVYQFLAVKTIDINTIEDRKKQKVVYKQPLGGGELMLVDRNSHDSQLLGESLRAIDFSPESSLGHSDGRVDGEAESAEEDEGEEVDAENEEE